MKKIIHGLLFMIAAGIVLASCATNTAYYKQMNAFIAESKFHDAAALNEKSKDSAYGSKNVLLYNLDRGMLLHLSGNYRESNEAFEKAKRLADSYFTKSVTAEASTLLISDNMRPYYGEDFERALIHVFSALNYVFLGQETEALVEARQVDHFLTVLENDYGHKNTYKEDAFARYLMGMIYENQGQWNDAFISYWKALEGYDAYSKVYGVRVPENLVADALRAAERIGFKEDQRKIIKKWGNPKVSALAAAEGEVIVLHYNGFAPVKIDNFFEISFGRAWAFAESMDVQGEEEEQVEQAAAIARGILAEEQVRMAFPRYVPSPYRISRFSASSLGADDAVQARSSGELVENIGTIAVKNLEERIGRVRVRTIARAAIKFALTQKISQSVEKNSNDQLLGWLTKKVLSVASTATELSDKRSWRSLPDTISMARLVLPKGPARISVTFYGPAGEVIETKTLETVMVRPGKKTFVVARSAS